jgi:hypothetical protein
VGRATAGRILKSGIDVDVAVLTAARLAGTVSLKAAARAILLALAVNAVARTLYTALTGPAAYSLRLGIVTIAALGLAAVAMAM